MTRISEKIIALVVVFFLLSYVGYQAYRYVYNPIGADTVYEYTVSRTITADGIAVRDERVLEQAATGVEYYPHEDASRVALGETVAEFYRGRLMDRNVKRSRDLEQELQLLLEAQATTVDYANTEVYNRDIKRELGQLSAMASTGRYADLDDLRRELTFSINRKLISNGKETGYGQRIGQLQSELASTSRSAPVDGGQVVKAPVAGYFSKTVDGYEGVLRTADLQALTIGDYLRIIRGETPAAETGRVGKMVLDQNWVFAVAVPAHNLEWIKQGQSVEIHFDQISKPTPATVGSILSEKDQEEMILLLRCNQMTDELINLRQTSASIVFQQHTGLRINTSDLRFRSNPDGTSSMGVYILLGGKVYFRLVEPIYEEPTFILSKTYYTADEYLEPQRQARSRKAAEEGTADEEPVDLTVEEASKAAEEAEKTGQTTTKEFDWYVMLFDQVITKGYDLYDGKTIQEY